MASRRTGDRRSGSSSQHEIERERGRQSSVGGCGVVAAKVQLDLGRDQIANIHREADREWSEWDSSEHEPQAGAVAAEICLVGSAASFGRERGGAEDDAAGCPQVDKLLADPGHARLDV